MQACLANQKIKEIAVTKSHSGRKNKVSIFSLIVN